MEEFRKEKNTGREILFNKILEVLKEVDPIAIHQFGSGRYGYQDEFSDIDLWITFPDEKIKEIVDKKENLFSKISPILVKSDAPQNAPIGGAYTLVVYETQHGLFQVDYYLSPKSGNNIRDDAIHLYGDHSLSRGEWVLDKDAVGKWDMNHIYDQILAMSYILNKAIVRGGRNKNMTNYLRKLYKDYQVITHHNLQTLPNSDKFEFIREIYKNLLIYGNVYQKKAVNKLMDYSDLIKTLYT